MIRTLSRAGEDVKGRAAGHRRPPSTPEGGPQVTIAKPDRRPVQPPLHDLAAAVHAPTTVLSGHDGQITAHGVQGVFYADLRALSEAVLRVAGQEPEPVMD